MALEKSSELELIRVYSIRDHRMGRTKYHWTEFCCPCCGARYTIDTVRKIEEEI